MRIGQLAEQAGMAPHTIRFYEREGLIARPGRTAGGYRDYREEALEELRFIRKAKALGLKLREVREVLEIAAGGRAPCTHVEATLRARLADVDARLKELRTLRATLRMALARVELDLSGDGTCRCTIIEGMNP